MSNEIESPHMDAKEIEQYEAKFDSKLTELQKAEEFSQDKILIRLDQAIQKRLSDAERNAFHAYWTEISGNTSNGVFNEEALTRLLVRRLPDSIKLISEGASPVLFRMIAKAGQIPFVNYSDDKTQELGSSASLLRGISVYVPKKNVLSHGGELEAYWILSREWSQVDYLKQIFLGIAKASSSSPSSREPDRGVYPGVHNENDIYWLDVSAEAPETTTMLDALSATPPGGRHAAIPRAQYKSVAESASKNQSSISSLKIRKADWLAIIKLTLALQSSNDPDSIDSAAENMLKDFTKDNAEEIDWPTWIEVMTKSHPDLVAPLEELFGLFFTRDT